MSSLGRCPHRGCAYRWRDGIDRPCADHAVDAPQPAVRPAERRTARPKALGHTWPATVDLGPLGATGTIIGNEPERPTRSVTLNVADDGGCPTDTGSRHSVL